MPTTPTPGAVRAANRIALFNRDKERFARIIDEETHTGELLAALQDFIDAATESSKNESYKANAYGFMMAVLPKARAALTAATKEN